MGSSQSMVHWVLPSFKRGLIRGGWGGEWVTRAGAEDLDEEAGGTDPCQRKGEWGGGVWARGQGSGRGPPAGETRRPRAPRAAGSPPAMGPGDGTGGGGGKGLCEVIGGGDDRRGSGRPRG